MAHFLVYNVLAKFQLFCIITCRDILYFVFWLPYRHTLWRHQYLICIIQKFWISLERDEIWQKGLSNSPIFQFLNFLFHRHFKSSSYICLPNTTRKFRVVLGEQIYLKDRAMKSVKMFKRFIEISIYFCFRSSKINSLIERTEESLLWAFFFKALGFFLNVQLSHDIPFVHSLLAGEILFFNLLIRQKVIFYSLQFCPSKWELYSPWFTWTNFRTNDTILTE